MPQWSIATYTKVYKARYPKGITAYLPKKENFYAWFEPDTGYGGEPWKVMIRTNAVRVSSDFATALAQRNAPTWTSFDINDFAEEHAVVSLSRKLMKKAGNSEHAIVRVVEQAVDAAVEACVLSMASKLQGNGGGSRGRVSTSAPTSTTFTLADSSRTYLFYEGMRFQASADDGATASPAGVRVGVGEITKIEDDVITFTPADAITGFAANDYIFQEGDYDSFSQRIIQGMLAWNPKANPGATDSFYGVNRSTNRNALSGRRVAASSQHIFDILREASAKVANNRGKVDTFWCNHLKGAEMDQFLGAKQAFTLKTAYVGVELTGFQVMSQNGPINVLTSSIWPELDGMLTSRGSWTLGSYGEVMADVDEDGSVWHLEEAKDSYQKRSASYVQLACSNNMGMARTQDNCFIDFAA